MYVLRWTLIAAPVSAVIGSLCALFLWSLERATHTRFDHPWLIWLMPVGGVLIALLYRLLGGKSAVERGNDLIIDEIHDPKEAGVPARLAPLILVSTVLTHLVGGSAGREGTAVQIGGGVASEFGRRLRLDRHDVRKLLMVGIAAGFGGVFGTPIAAAVFAMEVIAVGRISYEAIFPCLLAGIVGHLSCVAWGIEHTTYQVAVGPVGFDLLTAGKVALAAIAFGLVSVIFVHLTHRLKTLWQWLIPIDFLRPIAGSLVLIALVYLLGTRDYLGLGVDTGPGGHVSIVASFGLGGADAMSWFWKLLFTAITLSCGFKGGEVTPLFFIGATLGHSIARLTGGPVDVFAACGFVAVFAGATNTPLACTLMAIELFGAGHAVYFALACVIAYLFSGHSGIYAAQRIASRKGSPVAGTT